MMNDSSLLYLEDDPEILVNMTFLLKRYVQTVYTAEDGITALDLYLKHKPDILVLDIMVPGMNGIELAKKVRETNKKIPVVFMTAYNDDKYTEAAKAIPSSSFVQKPFNLETLNKAIEKALNEK